MQELTTIEVKGKKYKVSVDSEGRFYASHDNERVSADSLKQLENKLAGFINDSKKVTISFVKWERADWYNKKGRLRRGVITGIHAGNGNLLLKYDDEKVRLQQWSGSYYDPIHAEELEQLARAVEKAEAELEAFKNRHSFDGKARVRKLLAEEVSK